MTDKEKEELTVGDVLGDNPTVEFVVWGSNKCNKLLSAKDEWKDEKATD